MSMDEPQLIDKYYFGCWDRPGHGFHEPGGRSVNVEAESKVPWGVQIDGGLCPKPDQRLPREIYQIEGQAKLTHKDGWTALAFWDRSGDHRFGSNSTFVFHALLTFDSALNIAKTFFPEIFKRHNFEIVEVPNA